MEKVHPGSRKLITRGNLDGIACAAVFLHHFPEAEITFVSSPPAALKALRDRGPGEVWMADIALTKEIAEEMRRADGRVLLVDHHPTDERVPGAFVELKPSAAGLLHRLLGRSSALDRLAALADLVESEGTALLDAVASAHGMDRLEREAAMLDFSWRLIVEDDAFRLAAAKALSRGAWPSEVPQIFERFTAVSSGDRWTSALDKVRRDMVVHGRVGVLDTRGRRTTFRGFGSKALAAVARERGCRYAVMLQDGSGTTTVSLRSTVRGGVDLGMFIKAFAEGWGGDGGGHRASAGARLPDRCTEELVSELVRAAA